MVKKIIFTGFIALFALFLVYYALEKLNHAFEKVWSLILPGLFTSGVDVLGFTGIFVLDSILKFLLNLFVLFFAAFLIGLLVTAIKKFGLGSVGSLIKHRAIKFLKKLVGIKEEDQVGRPALVDVFGSGVTWAPALVMGTKKIIKAVGGNKSFILIHGYDTFPYHAVVRVLYLPVEQEGEKIIYLNVSISEFMSATFSGGLQWPPLKNINNPQLNPP